LFHKFEKAVCKKHGLSVQRLFTKKDNYLTYYLLTGFTPNVIKNMAQGLVFRGHYSNQFDRNDPQLLTLALFVFHLANLLEPL
jgi:hypothetical protein